jgi:hypothetical protein
MKEHFAAHPSLIILPNDMVSRMAHNYRTACFLVGIDE